MNRTVLAEKDRKGCWFGVRSPLLGPSLRVCAGICICIGAGVCLRSDQRRSRCFSDLFRNLSGHHTRCNQPLDHIARTNCSTSEPARHLSHKPRGVGDGALVGGNLQHDVGFGLERFSGLHVEKVRHLCAGTHGHAPELVHGHSAVTCKLDQQYCGGFGHVCTADGPLYTCSRHFSEALPVLGA